MLVTANIDTVADTFTNFIKSKVTNFSTVPKIALISDSSDNSIKRISSIIDTLNEVGAVFTHRIFVNDETTDDVIKFINELNLDASIHGIYVEESSFGKDRSTITDNIHAIKDIGSDSQFIRSVFLTQNSNLSPKIWAIKAFLETNGYYLLSPYTCAVIGADEQSRDIMNYFASLGSTTMILKPYTLDLKEVSPIPQIMVINDISLVPCDCYNKDAVIICTNEIPNFIEPTVGSLYLNYDNYFKLFKIGIAWNLMISYTTITKEEINNDD